MKPTTVLNKTTIIEEVIINAESSVDDVLLASANYISKHHG